MTGPFDFGNGMYMRYSASEQTINIYRFDAQIVWYVGVSSEGSVLSLTTSAPALQGNIYGLNGKRTMLLFIISTISMECFSNYICVCTNKTR